MLLIGGITLVLGNDEQDSYPNPVATIFPCRREVDRNASDIAHVLSNDSCLGLARADGAGGEDYYKGGSKG